METSSLADRLDREWGRSLVSTLGYCVRNDPSELLALLENNPDRFSRCVREIRPWQDDSESLRDEKLKTFKGLLDLVHLSESMLQSMFSRLTTLANLHALPFIEHLEHVGGDIHAHDVSNNGLSPYMAFLNGKDANFAQALIDRYGAHPNAVDEKGQTALDWVIANQYVETALVLIRTGWDPHRRSAPDRPSAYEKFKSSSSVDFATLVGEAIGQYRQQELAGQPMTSRRNRPRG